jgi:hypothetical protein
MIPLTYVGAAFENNVGIRVRSSVKTTKRPINLPLLKVELTILTPSDFSLLIKITQVYKQNLGPVSLLAPCNPTVVN